MGKVALVAAAEGLEEVAAAETLLLGKEVDFGGAVGKAGSRQIGRLLAGERGMAHCRNRIIRRASVFTPEPGIAHFGEIYVVLVFFDNVLG